jgi:hypothetical protein
VPDHTQLGTDYRRIHIRDLSTRSICHAVDSTRLDSTRLGSKQAGAPHLTFALAVFFPLSPSLHFFDHNSSLASLFFFHLGYFSLFFLFCFHKKSLPSLRGICCRGTTKSVFPLHPSACPRISHTPLRHTLSVPSVAQFTALGPIAPGFDAIHTPRTPLVSCFLSPTVGIF